MSDPGFRAGDPPGAVVHAPRPGLHRGEVAHAEPWLPGWAFHLALWEVFRWGGFAGLAVWRAAFAAAAVGVAVMIARMAGARGVVPLAILPLVIAVTRERLSARTEQVFVVLVLFALLCFESSRRGRDRAA